jgi:hypothetical protein
LVQAFHYGSKVQAVTITVMKRKFKHWWSAMPQISNIGGQQCHKYQTLVVNNATNIKHWWSTMPQISTNQTITSHVKSYTM